MEHFRGKRSQSARVPSPSKVTTIVDRSAGDKLIACDRHHGGGHQTAKQKFPKLESDSGPCYRDRITEEHRIAFELGRSSSIQPIGTLMKSLLADEMSKETESRRRAPSVIAKLMGLDGMPPQHSSYKQPKRSSDRKTLSAGSFRHRKVCDNQSCREIASEQPPLKDVYEVRESSKGQTDGCTSQVPANRRHPEDDMVFIRQKFMDAKRLSTDERLLDSKEFHDAVEVLDSNNHLFLKFLEEPDSLFAKHLHASQQSRCGHVRNLKMSNILNDNINSIGCQTGRGASKKIDISMSRECQASRHRHVSRGRASDLDKSATFPAEVNEIANDVPTKIVLLKPNLGGSQKTAKISSSSCELLSDVDTHKNTGHREADLWAKKCSPISLDVCAHKSQESERLAKEITQQMRNKLGEVSFSMPLPGYRGYSADESSHEVSGNDSSYESDASILSSHTPYHPSICRKSSASRYAESSVNKEGKKRMSERWKMTHRSEGISVGAKGSTLGEMLAISDSDMRLTDLDGEMNLDRLSGSFYRNDKLSGPVEPLGISSKDGWKDDCMGTLSRSKSLPTAYDHDGNPETCTKYVGSRNGRRKGVNRDLSWKEGLSSGVRSLGDKKPHSSYCINKETATDPQGFQVNRNGKKIILVEARDPSICNTETLEAPTCRLDSILNLDSVGGTEQGQIPGCAHSGDGLLPTTDFSTSLQVKHDSGCGLHETTQDPSKACHNDSPCLQYPGAQPESPASSKEADQPSPVSVLDAPFVEDLSSGSECFERVSAELHGLRMQLRLLKLETGAYGAGTISGDEDTEEGSAGSSEEPKPSTIAESWEAFYTADVLAEFELDDTNPDAFMSTWHFLECPAGPAVFEKLEKKYSCWVASCSRSDRRLLFDRINSSVLEIVQRFTDPVPWVSRSRTTMGSCWSKAWLEAELGARTKEDMADDGMQSHAKWMNLGECIDGIGCEIERILLDELVSEALTM